MKRIHFDFDIPFNDTFVEDGRAVIKHIGDLNVSGVGYMRDGKIWYDMDKDVYVKSPDDVSPIGERVPETFLAIMKAKGITLPDEQDIINAIMNHLEYRFAEQKAA